LRRFYRRSGFFSQWRGLARSLGRYWKIYGGWDAARTSPYVHISLLLSIFALLFSDVEENAADVALSTIPNLLGFTVGAMAIVLAFSSAKAFVALAEGGEPNSFFMKLAASLIHFILVQVLALTVGIFAKVTKIGWLDIVVLFLLFYGVLTAFAAGMQLFYAAIIYNAGANSDDATKETRVDDFKENNP